MLIVIAIMGIMSGVVFINYRGNEKQVILDNAAAKVAQDIRRVRELALRAQDLECSPGVKVTSYGIEFDDRPTPVVNPKNVRYILYGNCDSQLEYNVGTEFTIETVQYSGFTSPNIVTLNVIPPSNPEFHSAFVAMPPNPDMQFAPHSSATSLQVEIGYDASQKRVITVTTAGIVEVQ